MKSILLLCALLATVSAAQGPAMLDAPRLVSINAVPLFAADGVTLVSFHVTTTWSVLEAQPSGKSELTLKVVQFDLVRQKMQRVTLNGQTFELGDLPDDLIGVSLIEFQKAFPSPLPVERKALRAKQAPNTP